MYHCKFSVTQSNLESWKKMALYYVVHFNIKVVLHSAICIALLTNIFVYWMEISKWPRLNTHETPAITAPVSVSEH